MVHDTARVEAIRVLVQAQIELIESLKAMIVKGDLEALNLARNQTEDVEAFFLGDLERRDRTPVEERRWLDAAEHMLGVWGPYLTETEAQFKRRGDRGIVIIGG